MVGPNGEVIGAGPVSVSGGRSGGGGSGSRVMDGRSRGRYTGGGGGPISAAWERERDMDDLCQEICRILKEDQKVRKPFFFGWIDS